MCGDSVDLRPPPSQHPRLSPDQRGLSTKYRQYRKHKQGQDAALPGNTAASLRHRGTGVSFTISKNQETLKLIQYIGQFSWNISMPMS